MAALPNTIAGRAIGGQLVRSARQLARIFEPACRDRSKPEFVAKLGIAEEEADESGDWMEMIIEGELLKPKLVQPLLNEVNELTKIFAQSRNSASRALQRAKRICNRQSAIGNRQ